MLRNGYDETNGTIIGGYDYIGQVYYDGRAQGRKIYAESESEIIAIAEAYVKEQKAEFSGFPCYLFPDDKWELRIR